MKKVLLIIAMLTVNMTIFAQNEIMSIDRDVTFSGVVKILSKDQKLNRETAKMYEEGTKFFLQNKNVDGDNFVTFWIESPDGKKSEYNTWKDNDTEIILLINKNGNNFGVRDDTFNYLNITSFGEFSIVTLYTRKR